MDMPKESVPSKVTSMLQEIRSRVKVEEALVNDIPVSVLIWGPSPSATCAVSALRMRIRLELTNRGHLAKFSEELVDEGSPYSTKTQQLMLGQHFDLIVSMPTTYGSIAEIHDFISDNRLNKRMMIFLDETFDYGYSFQSLLATATQNTYSAKSYKGDSELHKIEAEVYEAVKIIKEIKYLNLGRWL